MTQKVDEKVADSKWNGKVEADSAPAPDLGISSPTRAGARLHVESPETATSRFQFPISIFAPFVAWLKATWKHLLTISPYSDHPASIKDVVDHTRKGGWVPGERSILWESPGYIYGAAAISVTIVLYAVAWLIQRPSRVFVFALIIVLLKWTT